MKEVVNMKKNLYFGYELDKEELMWDYNIDTNDIVNDDIYFYFATNEKADLCNLSQFARTLGITDFNKKNIERKIAEKQAR